MLRLTAPLTFLSLAALAAAPACATTIDLKPRPARLLAGGDQFLAQDSMESVSLYRSDGRMVYTLPSDGLLAAFDVTADERRVLVASKGGGVALWALDTGQAVWRAGGKQTGLNGVCDACLSQDGTACVVCNYMDFAVVLNGRTGAVIGRVGFPPQQTNIMSAALAPDGRTGVLIDLGERVFAFDVATGVVRATGLTGAWPIRYTPDGRYAACRSNNSGSAEQLRVIAVGTWQAKDVGRFSHIGHIRPTTDGGFLVTARVDNRAAGNSAVVGVRYSPGAAEPEEVWRRRTSDGCDILTDFGGDPVRGVSTDFRLVTQLTDLRTGETVRVIDNSVNYRPTYVSWSSSVPNWQWRAAGVTVVVFALAAGAFVLRQRTKRHTGGGHQFDPNAAEPAAAPNPAGKKRDCWL